MSVQPMNSQLASHQLSSVKTVRGKTGVTEVFVGVFFFSFSPLNVCFLSDEQAHESGGRGLSLPACGRSQQGGVAELISQQAAQQTS